MTVSASPQPPRHGHCNATRWTTLAQVVDAINSRQQHATLRPERPNGRTAPLLFIVDDDVSTLELICDVAEDSGWTARGFTHLRELRARLYEDRPSLVILDDDLPDGSGGELARELRTDPGTEDLPVLVCTAAHPERQAEIGDWAPVVSKPFDLDDIERYLDDAARHRSGGHEQRAAG